jgi:L-asparaginase/Glu-tRNA(Gln) amidotransferase subunit D
MAFSQINILVIYTSGTIGMVRNKETGSLHPVIGSELYEHIPVLGKLDVFIRYWLGEEQNRKFAPGFPERGNNGQLRGLQ